MYKLICYILAIGFGSGLSPIVPGTVGTLMGILIYLTVAQLSLPIYLALTVILFFLGIGICNITAHYYFAGNKDPRAIVWDEIVGFLATMSFIEASWFNIALGFFLFRFFDIVKPYPGSYVDKHMDGGLGIMLDDIVAAVYANLSLQLIIAILEI